MMSIDILIIDALSAGTGHRGSSRDSIGCGPRTVAGVFETLGIDSRIRRVEQVLNSKSYMRKSDHLAISSMSMDFKATKDIIKIWRRTNKKGKIVLGGPITSGGGEVLRLLKPDVMVIGEGERTLERLIKADFFEGGADLENIAGIGYMSNSQPVITQSTELMTEEELSRRRPSTTRITDYQAYQASRVYVEVVRGCSNFRRTTLPLSDEVSCTQCERCDSPNYQDRLDCPQNVPPGCGFCSVPSTWGPPRSRNIKSITEEVEALLDLGVHRIVLEAPDFLDYRRGQEPQTDPCSPPANIEAISELLERLAEVQVVAAGDCHIGIENVKACLFSEKVAETIAQHFPNTSPNIGLETGSKAHMKAVGKCGTPKEVLQAVIRARKYGMKPFVYFIHGLPGETRQSVHDSLQMMRSLSDTGAERIILYGFRPLPGSAFAEFPPAKHDSEASRLLHTEVERINRLRKENYIGRTLKGVAAEPSLTHHGYTMVYPLEEGPIMTVQGGHSPGKVVMVRIEKVLSPGLVEAVVL